MTHDNDEGRSEGRFEGDRADKRVEGVKVRAHPGLCFGHGNCHRFAPEVYPLDDEGLIDIHLLDVPAELALQAWIGASVCPERAITVIGEPESYWIKRRSESKRSQ